MGISRWISEIGVDSGDEIIGDCVLDVFGLDVDLIPTESERLHQEEFDETVTSEDIESELLPGGAERGSAVGLVIDETRFCEALEHRRDASRSDREFFGDLSGGGSSSIGGGTDLIDGLDVVFDLRILHADAPRISGRNGQSDEPTGLRDPMRVS